MDVDQATIERIAMALATLSAEARNAIYFAGAMAAAREGGGSLSAVGAMESASDVLLAVEAATATAAPAGCRPVGTAAG